MTTNEDPVKKAEIDFYEDLLKSDDPQYQKYADAWIDTLKNTKIKRSKRKSRKYVFAIMGLILTGVAIILIIDRLTPPNWEKIALRNRSDNDRVEAVKNITDQSVLAKIAVYQRPGIGLNLYDSIVCEAATTKLEDQELLIKIARNELQSDVREVAAVLIEDQGVLSELAQNSESITVRAAAIEHLSDQAMLEKIAQKDQNEYARWMATDRISSQEVLSQIVLNDRDLEVREIALLRITDKKLQAAVAQAAIAQWEQQYSRFNKLIKLNQEESMPEGTDRTFSSESEKLPDENIFFLIAENSQTPYLARIAALYQLKNPAYLLRIVGSLWDLEDDLYNGRFSRFSKAEMKVRLAAKYKLIVLSNKDQKLYLFLRVSHYKLNKPNWLQSTTIES